jgi:Ca2+-binding EF-hand superfamily protein
MDTNKDGILSRAELDAEVARTFVKLDRDDNDAITAAEARGGGGGGTAMSGFVGQHFAEVDEDGDGIVSRIELAAVASRMFKRGDADADGQISAAEFSAMKAAGKRTPAQ